MKQKCPGYGVAGRIERCRELWERSLPNAREGLYATLENRNPLWLEFSMTIRQLVAPLWFVALIVPVATACHTSSGEPVEATRVSPAEIARTDSTADLVEITSVAVDSKGHAYVADFYARKVSVFGPRGELRGTIGRGGSGPGEFRQLRTVRIGPGDSLDVYDSGNVRLSVYSPGMRRPAYELDLRAWFQGLRPPREVWRFPRDSNLLALFEEPHRDKNGFEIRERLAVYRGSSNSVLDSALMGPKHPMLRAEAGRNHFLTPDPFRRGAMITVGPSGDAAGVSRNGDTLFIARKPGYSNPISMPFEFTPAHVTSADRDKFVESLDTEWIEAAVRRVMQEAGPSRWPRITHVLLDDVGRLWIQLGTRPSERTEWRVLSQTGEESLAVSLPPDAIVRAVVGDRLFASREFSNGEPYLAIFDLEK